MLVIIQCVHCFHFCGLLKTPLVFSLKRSLRARMKIKTTGNLMTRHKRKGGGGGGIKRHEIDGLWTSLGATEISFFLLFSRARPRKRKRLWTGYHFLSLFHCRNPMSLTQLHLTSGVEYFALKGNIREQSFL